MFLTRYEVARGTAAGAGLAKERKEANREMEEGAGRQSAHADPLPTPCAERGLELAKERRRPSTNAV
ncbi:hypothetical protein [Candidatus Amarobacter glycogenicus]|uniref:hypothetical protein n=1 Tax=Candidatus Amarobacter glycogenicus TaxID=3140699 RepID=UPI002A154055|nr:hypothetical protein [Dehalococcoidia bacterium]